MKKFMEEFKTFALRGNVMDMAIGVMIGSAFSGIVTSLTDNFIYPIIYLLTGQAVYTLEDVAAFASAFLSSVVNFLIMSLVLFCLLKAVNKALAFGKKSKKPTAPATKICPYCRSTIPKEATRCAYCTSQLPQE